jgi:hypothetical protein
MGSLWITGAEEGEGVVSPSTALMQTLPSTSNCVLKQGEKN